MIEVWDCLLRPSGRESAVKYFSQGHNRMAKVGFEPQWFQSRSPSITAPLTTQARCRQM